jgi:probable rRNA maturation factor
VADTHVVVEFVEGSELWRGYEDALSKALHAAAESEGAAGGVSVLLGDDEEVAKLNQQFRDKAGPTNVLSFPPVEPEQDFLGDIALAAETIAAEASVQGKSFQAHASHLLVHGFLHLLGYDHQTPAEAEAMEARERAILASIGIEDPYA